MNIFYAIITYSAMKFTQTVAVSYTHLDVYKRQLIDCVGFLADGAVGHMEGNGSRMVKTPWSDQEIPFAEAASIGTCLLYTSITEMMERKRGAE